MLELARHNQAIVDGREDEYFNTWGLLFDAGGEPNPTLRSAPACKDTTPNNSESDSHKAARKRAVAQMNFDGELLIMSLFEYPLLDLASPEGR